MKTPKDPKGDKTRRKIQLSKETLKKLIVRSDVRAGLGPSTAYGYHTCTC